MPVYYVELEGGDLTPLVTLEGGDVYPVSGGEMPDASAPYLSYAEIEDDGSIYVDMEIDQGGYIANDTYPLTKPNAVAMRTSSDMTTSGATVTAPAGYYKSATSKVIPDAALILSDAVINLDGSIEAEVKATSGGYVSQGNHYLTVEDVVTMKGAQTYYPSSSDQAITAWQYLSGDQTIKGVTTTNLLAENIKKDVVVQVGDSADPDRIVSVTGAYEGGGGGITPDGMASGSEPVGAVVLNTATSTREGAFRGCVNITSIHAKLITNLSQYMVTDCASLTTFVSESQTTGGYNAFSGARQLTAIDINHRGSPSNGFFGNCASLTTLILRRTDAITALGTTGAFNGSPFASNGTGGTLYVPSSLISSYQSATNWSTILGYANNSIQAIEGSQYENYYADGTPIS